MEKEEQIKKLKSNAVFQMSLASRELFHSNFIYWLSIYDKEKFKSLVDALTGKHIEWPNNWVVLRENNHLDLCIRRADVPGQDYKDFLIVIENKVKSIVTKAQLDDYLKKVANENAKFNNLNCSFVLLSLADNYLDKDNILAEKQWTIRNYAEYAVFLRNIYLSTEDPTTDFSASLIEQYVKYIETISDISFFDLPELADSWAKTGIDSLLDSVRIDDLRQKLIANEMASYIKKKLPENLLTINKSDKDIWEDCHDHTRIYLTAGFANNRALIHLSFFAEDDVMVRFEIEGDKYKRSVIIKKDNMPKNEKGKVKENYDWQVSLSPSIKGLFFKNDSNDTEPAISYPSALNGEWGLKKKDFGTYDMEKLMKYQSKLIPSNSIISEVLDGVLADFHSVYKVK